jgi:uncharacterized protein (TIGR02266 family)
MTSLLHIRPTVLLPLREQHAFLDYYFNQGDLGGVFVPGNLRLASAEEVDLEIVFAKEQVTVHTRGVIRWKRLSSKRDMPAGVGIEFLASERRTRDMLLELAKGKTINLAKRKNRRYPAMIQIEYATNSVFMTDVTDDVSREGASILTDEIPEIGAVLKLRLKVPNERQPIELKGEVRWRQTEGRKSFGVQFLFESPQSQERIAGLVERIKQQIAAELSFATAPQGQNQGSQSTH